jgi:hypothetical protein
VIQLQFILYPPSNKPQTQTKKKSTLEPPKNNVLKQSSYNTISHTYNTIKNPQQKQPTPTYLPLLNTILPRAPHFPSNSGKEYDLVEKLKNTPTRYPYGT